VAGARASFVSSTWSADTSSQRWHVNYRFRLDDVSEDESARWMPPFLALLRTHARLKEQLELDVRRISGLSLARYDVLMHLDMAGGRLRLRDLAEAVILSPSGLSKLIDRMQESGLVERQLDPDDARSTFAAITRHGLGLVEKTRQRHHAYLQHIFGDVLDDRDLADLARIMARLEAGLWSP
jgi:DNA-binding MarR family transcriptional regulator